MAMSRRKSECLIVPAKQGNPDPGGACGGKGASGNGIAGGNDGGDFELREHLTETPASSGTGQREAAAGVDHAGPPHRRRLPTRSLPQNPQGRGERHRRTNSRGVRGKSGCEPEGLTRAVQVRSISSARGAAGSHSKRGWDEDPSDRDPDLRGQGGATGGGDGVGGHLRAAVS